MRRTLVRVAVLLAAAIVVYIGVTRLFRSREERLWDFVDEARNALVEGRDAEFLAYFDPGVEYQRGRGLPEIERDLKRFRGSGIGVIRIIGHQAQLDEAGATVNLNAVLVAGLRPVAEVKSLLRVAERDGKWFVTAISWE